MRSPDFWKQEGQFFLKDGVFLSLLLFISEDKNAREDFHSEDKYREEKVRVQV